MLAFYSLVRMTGARRWAPLLGAIGLMALCCGCIVYTGGGYGPHSWHGGYRYR